TPGRFEILVITNSEKLDGREMHSSMFEPALFHLALLASAEPNADGMSALQWLAAREFVLHISYAGGIVTWTYPAGSITSAEATHYFLELTRDFLTPTTFDLLPFEMMRLNKELMSATLSDIDARMTPETFCAMLEEQIAATQENPQSWVKIPQVVEMMQAKVPADALAKVQRRFRLLDRGPASVRQQPKVAKKRPAKQKP
ncbi:MAG: hypothetical protein HY289_06215, partial [Planctomycetes bacterium]|nr:hypothetical protein [Planctomycetota bacterium]